MYQLLKGYVESSVLAREGSLEDHTPFVLQFTSSEFGSLPHVDADTQEMVVVVTTRTWLGKLLSSAKSHFGGCLSLDAKHKVTWNRIPVIPLLVVDADGHGHIIGLGISNSEEEKYIRLMCEGVFYAAGVHHPTFLEKYACEVRYGKSDGADAYGNAGTKLEYIEKWTNCWMHLVVCNLTKNGTGLNKALGLRCVICVFYNFQKSCLDKNKI